MNAFSSTSAFRSFLTAGSTEERVRRFSVLCSVPVRCAQEMKQEEKVTVDMDDTIIPTERGADGAYFHYDKPAFLWIRTGTIRWFFYVGGNVRIKRAEKPPCGRFIENNLWNEGGSKSQRMKLFMILYRLSITDGDFNGKRFFPRIHQDPHPSSCKPRAGLRFVDH